jgi:heme A synthase
MQLTAVRADRAIGNPAAVTLTAGIALYLAALSMMTAVLRVPRRESLSRWRAALITALGILAVAGRGLDSTVFVAVSLFLALIHVAVNIARDRRTTAPVSDDVTGNGLPS